VRFIRNEFFLELEEDEEEEEGSSSMDDDDANSGHGASGCISA
jgi:hypothetical protein